METWDAVGARRNVRTYQDRPVPREDLERILEAGRRAPSSKNTQPWDFVVVTERERLTRLARVWRGAGHIAGSAATIALVTPVTEAGPMRAEYDLGQATMSMLLVATDLGVGTGHSAVYDQEMAREVLGLPGDQRCAYLIALGYPADRPLTPIRNPARRPLAEITHWETW
jgi:nitroreductase